MMRRQNFLIVVKQMTQILLTQWRIEAFFIDFTIFIMHDHHHVHEHLYHRGPLSCVYDLPLVESIHFLPVC